MAGQPSGESEDQSDVYFAVGMLARLTLRSKNHLWPHSGHVLLCRLRTAELQGVLFSPTIWGVAALSSVQSVW